ncbi:MAG: carbohydrate ABC transporter permease [Actinobacteria bacterium]|nr:carbohydrate ABC transporter permease [Actinomycetota bacterium]
MKRKKYVKSKYTLSNIILIIVLLIFFMPALWIVLTSMRPNIEINARPPVWMPQDLSFSSYAALLGYVESAGEFGFGHSVPFMDYARNSIIASVASTFLALFIGTLAAFIFSSFKFKGKDSIFLSFMLARAVPGIALSLPLLILFTRVGFSDKIYGLIIAYTAMNIPFTVWLMTGFFGEIPKELNDAAFIDGCSRWGAFLKVNLPLILPGIGASGIFAFLTSWNEFAIASVITRTTASKTFPVGLFDFTGEFVSDWRGMCAMSVIMLIPAIIFVILVQRNLVKGLTLGAVKG